MKGMITDLINRLQSTSHCRVAASVCIETSKQQRHTILDVNHSPRMIESASRRVKSAKHIEHGMIEAVVQDDDDEQLGGSSSDKTLRQGLADGQSRGATVDLAPDVLAAGQHQNVRVCVERCPLTTRHAAKRSGDSCQARALGRDLSSRDDTTALAGLQRGSRSGPRSAIAASLCPSPRVDHEWHSDVTSQIAALEPTTSTRSARRGSVVLVWQPADHAQHVE